jgi:hypothetical protein
MKEGKHRCSHERYVKCQIMLRVWRASFFVWFTHTRWDSKEGYTTHRKYLLSPNARLEAPSCLVLLIKGHSFSSTSWRNMQLICTSNRRRMKEIGCRSNLQERLMLQTLLLTSRPRWLQIVVLVFEKWKWANEYYYALDIGGGELPRRVVGSEGCI